MKLYSKRHIIFYSLLSSLIILLIATFISFLSLQKSMDSRPSISPEEIKSFIDSWEEYGTKLKNASLDPDELSEDESNNIEIYEKLNSGVVNITSITFSYDWFFQPVPKAGTGSGSIIGIEGYVLTNYHVVKDAEDLTLTLANGSEFKGYVIGIDPENDLAVLKFNPGDKILTAIPLGLSSDLKVGQKVLAIGNPFALERTMTTGIVSGLGRPVETDDDYVIRDMIQTDASINPGNSGGPLLNSNGEMIGVNTMIYSPSGGSVGIGFAVPVDTARRVIPDLIEHGKVARGWIDIIFIPITQRLAQYVNFPREDGLLISDVAAGSEAEKAGLRGGNKKVPYRLGSAIIYLNGDIILEIDGLKVYTWADFLSALEDNKPGEKVEVTIWRDNREIKITVKLSERSEKYLR